MKEEWLMPGAVVPVDPDTTKALVDEIKRLIGIIGGMALQARSAPVQKPYRPLQDNGSQYFGDSWDTLPTQPAPVQECLAHGECFGGKCIYTTPPAAQRQCNWPTCQSEEYQRALAEQIKQELVTGAAQRQWVGLTDEEIDKTRFAIQTKAITQRDHELSRAIEAKLRSKNNG